MSTPSVEKASRRYNAREVAALAALLCIIVLLVQKAWLAPLVLEPPPAPEPTTVGSSLERHVFQTQAKLLIGAQRFAQTVSSLAPPSPDTQSPAISQKDPSQEITHAAIDLVRAPQSALGLQERHLVREKAILAKYLSLSDSYGAALSLLQSDTNRSAEEQALDDGLRASIEEQAPLTASVRATLSSTLPFFESVLLAAEGDSAAQTLVQYESDRLFRRCLVLFGIGVLVLILSLCFCIILSVWFYSGRTRLHYEEGPLPSHFRTEIFLLYLLAMLFSPLVVDLLVSLGVTLPRLALSGLVILVMSLLVCWPLVWGQSFSAITQTLGVRISSVGHVLREACVGPLGYLTAWLPLLVVLAIYAAFIAAIGADVTQGTHPIVPLLFSRKDPETFMYVALLAVVVAPIVEEIMFRGVLYSYLRSRMRPIGAMVASSFIFAVVHPQGPLGLIPLMSIGLVLAFLREWRGSLFPSILAHACFNAGTITIIYVLFL